MKKLLNKFFISSLIFLSCCATHNINLDKQIAKNILSKNEFISAFDKDGNGNIYVIIKERNTRKILIKKISNDNLISTIYQTNDYISKILSVKNDLYFSEELYGSSESDNNKVGLYKINLNNISKPPTLVVGGKSKESFGGNLDVFKIGNFIEFMDYDNNGNIYFLDIEHLRDDSLTHLRKLDLLKSEIRTIKINEDLIDNLYLLSKSRKINFTVNKIDNKIYITDDISLPSPDYKTSNPLREIDNDGVVRFKKFNSTESIEFYRLDEKGNFYIITKYDGDKGGHKIIKINKDNTFMEIANHSYPVKDVIIDNKNQIIYILDSENRIFKIPLKEKI